MGDTTLMDAALRYAADGMSVLALLPKSKIPATTNGFKDATTDELQIRDAWGEIPDLNIGIATGSLSRGMFVIDIDVGDGKDGSATLMEWEDAHGALPTTATAVTGGGGIHIFYYGDGPVRSSVNATSGVDIRADGGYVVVPPSVHPSGTTYHWQPGHDPATTPIATADANTMAFVRSVQRGDGADGTRFILPKRVTKGNRNDVVFKLACSMQSRGADDDEIMARCVGENILRFTPPLPDDELRKTVDSAMRYDKGDAADQRESTGGGGEEDQPKADAGSPWWHENRNGTKSFHHEVMGDLIITEHHACLIGGAPAVWTGRCYEIGTKAIERQCILMDRSLRKQQRGEVISYVQSIAPEKDPLMDFDGEPWVAFRNGCVNPMEPFEMVEPRESMFITNIIPWDLTVTGDVSDAEAFLDSLACGDIDTFTNLQEVIGICMCSKRLVSVSPMLIGKSSGDGGEASNGKSSFLDVLRHVIGESNTSSLDIATIGSRFQAQRIVGKLANIGDDISSDYLKGDELSTFKKIVTGDRLYSDVKNGDGFEFTPMATMVFSMNAMPRMGDATAGTMRRLFPIPFRARFVEGEDGCDPLIVEKMTQPKIINQFLNIGLMGLSEVARKHVMTVNQAMVEEIREVQIDNDSVRRWIDDDCLTEADFIGVPLAFAYQKYRYWSEKSGEKFTVTKATMCNRIRKIFGLDTIASRKVNQEDMTKVMKVFTKTVTQVT